MVDPKLLLLLYLEVDGSNLRVNLYTILPIQYQNTLELDLINNIATSVFQKKKKKLPIHTHSVYHFKLNYNLIKSNLKKS